MDNVLVPVNSEGGLMLFIYASLGYCFGAMLFGFAGFLLSFLTTIGLRAVSSIYYGWWWDMRFAQFGELDCNLEPRPRAGSYQWMEDIDGFWRPTTWYERIIARWVNEKGST